MLTIIAYISGILGAIASIIEILQFLKILTLKNKLIWFIAVIVTSTLCFYIYYKIDTRREQERIELVKNEFIKKDAQNTVDAILISGWEESGDYLGYLIQITGFYGRHQEIYLIEYTEYKKQLKSWRDFFEMSRQNNRFYQGYSYELSELKGLVTSGRKNIEKLCN